MTTHYSVPVASPIRLCSLSTAIVGLFLVTGCGASDKTCPVSGQILFNDRPAHGVYVVFHLISGAQGQQSSARTNEDGMFSLRMPEPGEYAVTLFWPTVTVEGNETIEGEDYFKGQYRNPLHPVQKVSISEGENALPPIKLTSP